MIYCKNCGRPLDDGMLFCPDCGASQADATAPSSQSGQAEAPVNGTDNSVPTMNINLTSTVTPAAPNVSVKSRTVALLLCIFLGGIGIHRFYVGKVGTGLIWMFTLGLGGIGTLFDLVLIIVGSYTDKSGLLVTRW